MEHAWMDEKKSRSLRFGELPVNFCLVPCVSPVSPSLFLMDTPLGKILDFTDFDFISYRWNRDVLRRPSSFRCVSSEIISGSMMSPLLPAIVYSRPCRNCSPQSAGMTFGGRRQRHLSDPRTENLRSKQYRKGAGEPARIWHGTRVIFPQCGKCDVPVFVTWPGQPQIFNKNTFRPVCAAFEFREFLEQHELIVAEYIISLNRKSKRVRVRQT